MRSKSKSATVRRAARTRDATPPGRRAREADKAPEVWEQTAQVPDDRNGEIDCQRIVRGDGSRSLPLYYDDYN